MRSINLLIIEKKIITLYFFINREIHFSLIRRTVKAVHAVHGEGVIYIAFPVRKGDLPLPAAFRYVFQLGDSELCL